MKIFGLVIIVLFVMSCSKEQGAASTRKSGSQISPKEKTHGTMNSVATPSRKASGAPVPKVKGVPSPALITVMNDTGKSLSFDTTYGEWQPFGVVSLSGKHPPSLGFGPCHCPCGGSCPESAKPLPKQVTLAPGKGHSFKWGGHFTVQEKNKGRYGWCCKKVAPLPGKYTVTACAREGICAATQVSLPTSGPVVIKMSSVVRAASCSDVNMKVATSVAHHFVKTRLASVKKGSASLCTGTVSCVSPKALEGSLGKARGARCTLFAIPRGNEVEVLAFVPLAKSSVGGERFSIFYNPPSPPSDA